MTRVEPGPAPDDGQDAFSPSEVARLVETRGVAKATAPFLTTLVLGVVAGAFIALGAVLSTTIATGSGLGFGPTRWLAGVGFSLGLILVFDGMAFGVARPHEPSRFAYAFGNPTVVPQGPRYASRKSAGLAIVTLGGLQAWVVDPTIFHAARISFPKRVVILEPGLKCSALRGMPLVPRLEDVVVNNGEHDIVDLFDRLNAWASARSSG
ncbi:MAG: formate/nitrite transporter family protein [Actinomycetota bacterium]